MPTYRSISIELHSQFDAGALPEFFPRPQSYYDKLGIPNVVPELVNEETSTCSVYVPVLPASQFWITYRVSPPIPEDQHFLFKLFINGMHVVNWSCGRSEKWKGKTMFGLYEREEGWDGKRGVEKRALCFTPPDQVDGKWKSVTDAFDTNAYMEICVHRATGRKRVAREVQEYANTPHAANGRGIDLVTAGRAGAEIPKRYYKFALVDPIGSPFATFRYHYRTWDQMQHLGLLDGDNEDSILEVIEPHEPETDRGKKERQTREEAVVRRGDPGDVPTSVSRDDEARCSTPSAQAHYVPTGAPRKESRKSDEAPDGGPKQSLQVSPHDSLMPPLPRRHPPEPRSRPLPSIPPGKDMYHQEGGIDWQ